MQQFSPEQLGTGALVNVDGVKESDVVTSPFNEDDFWVVGVSVASG